MASRFGNRTYSRPNKVCQASIQFEKAFLDKTTNRPSAAKSTGMLHKWGKTSFTSTRSNQLINGQKERSRQEEPCKKPKLDMDDPFSFGDLDGAEPRNKSTKSVSKTMTTANTDKSDNKVSLSYRKPNKFFKSGNRSTLNAFHDTIAPFCKESKNTPLANVASKKFDQICTNLTPCHTVAIIDNSINKNISGSDFSVDVDLDDLLDDSPSPVPKRDDDEDFLVVNKGKAKKQFKSYSSSQSQDDTGPSCATRSRTRDGDIPQIKNTEVVFDTRGMSLDDERTRDQIWSSLLAKPTTKPENELSSSPVIELSQSNSVNSQTTDNHHDFAVHSSSTNSQPEFVPPATGLQSSTELDSSIVMIDTAIDDKSKVDHEENIEKMFDDEEENVELEISFISDVGPNKNSSPLNSLDFDFLDSGEEENDTQVLVPSTDSQGTSYDSQLSSSQTSSQPVFKTRRIFNSPKKFDKKALYKHRPWHVDEDQQEKQREPSNHDLSIIDEFDEDDTANLRLVRVTTSSLRSEDEPVTSVRCSKKLKELYKVVKNVKQAHQCHEIGETQEFNDDIEYLLGGLQNTIPVSMRCLSILSLASKCMAPGFRMHLRAEGTISQIFSALTDAPADSNLSLCTATLMFVLSQDRLNMDLDKGSLELMLQLLESESTGAVQPVTKVLPEKEMRELDRNRIKVRELCEEAQRKGKGHAKHFNLDNITVGQLAMETLLSLTSRRAGEWFKEELRELGGLDHIVETISECTKNLGRDLKKAMEQKLDKISKIDRCLRVLENVTMMNTENQLYLIDCKSSLLIESMVEVFKFCIAALPSLAEVDKCEKDSPGFILLNCVLSLLKVFLNLTNENSKGSSRIGEQEGLIDISMHCILHISKVIPVDQVFDLLVLMLGLLINLMEHCTLNRRRLYETQVAYFEDMKIPAIKILVDLFLEREQMAQREQVKTDRLLDGKGDQDSDNEDNDGTSLSQGIQDIEVTITKALQKAGKHMEDSMIAAYVSLLLGCFIDDNETYTRLVRSHLPEQNFQNMVQVLQKFYNFVTLTSTVGNTGTKSIQRVIEILKSS